MRHCSPCSGSPIVRRCISNATSPYAEVNRSVERLPITTPVWNLGRPMCRSTWPPINISTCVAREVARASLRVICLKWKRTRFFLSLHVSRKIYIFQRNESRWYVTIYRFQRERTHHCASLVLDVMNTVGGQEVGGRKMVNRWYEKPFLQRGFSRIDQFETTKRPLQRMATFFDTNEMCYFS